MALGWGIVGIGRIADTQMAPAISALGPGSLVAVVSRDQGRSEAFAERHGARRAYTSYEQLLGDSEVDVVLVATPNSLHSDQVVLAAQAGKHVLCDKPLAVSVAAARRAVSACEAAGISLGINFQTRHHPCFEEVKRLLEGGAIGQPLLIQVQASVSIAALSGWRADTGLAGLGAIYNIGVHAYDLLRYLTSAEVRSVTAMFEVGAARQLERLAMVILEFDNGVRAYVTANQYVPGYPNRFEAFGSEGSIRVTDMPRLWVRGRLELTRVRGNRVIDYQGIGDNLAYRRAVVDFDESARTGKPARATGLDGVRSAELSDAIARSVHQGMTVTLT